MAYEAERAQFLKIKQALAVARQEFITMRQTFPDVKISLVVKDGLEEITIRDLNGLKVQASVVIPRRVVTI